MMAPEARADLIDAARRAADGALDRALARALHAHAAEKLVLRKRQRHRRQAIILLASGVGVGAGVLAAPEFVSPRVAAALTGIFSGVVIALLLVPVGASRVGEERRHRLSLSFKRLFDATLAGMAVGASLPLLAAITIGLKLEAPHLPALYRQARVGNHGKIFQRWRFRTFIVNRDGSSGRSRVGRFLMATSLSDLPMLFNVLAADMSIVGPRAATTTEVVRGVSSVPMMKPGIVGPNDFAATISIEEAQIVDRGYESNWSLAADLRLIARSVVSAVAPSSTSEPR